METRKDCTVTTTETAKNGVKVKTVDEPGKDVTARSLFQSPWVRLL